MSKSWKLFGAAVVMAGGMSGMAIADGYEYEPVTDYAPPPPVYSWTGTYIGFNAGWIRSESSATLTGASGFLNTPTGAALLGSSFSNDRDGFLAGLTLGYNANFGSSFVGGIESDIAYTDVDGSQTVVNSQTGVGFTNTGTTTASTDMQWFGTLRARAGWLASRDLLIYATGGLAYANLETRGAAVYNSSIFGTVWNGRGSGSEWKTGWTVGGGFEWLLGNKTTLKSEYLYYDLDDSSVTIAGPAGFLTGPGTATFKSENKGHIVRMGLNVAMY